ncbi:MAG TPA: tryptophan 7-halogenase [Opitutaceae bacterium]|nr:tryptophan 7-halogenase [Opitutaceae bacterium]
MKSFDYDVFVIGGGPAGSSAASFARKAGLKVCLAEKETFPRFHIGESLLPNGNALYKELGVWPKLESAGFIKKYGAYFFLANGRAEKEIIFAEGIVPGLEYAFQVERAKFDQILLDHSRELGAEVHMATTVTQVQSDPEGHRLTLKNAEGERSVTARWVIDASGRENVFTHETKRALDPSPFPKRVAIYNHFENVIRPTGPAAGHTSCVRLADGWFWMIPIDERRTSVGLVTTVEALRAAKAEPAEVFRRAVNESSKLTEMMSGAVEASAFRVTSDYSYFRRDLAKDRFIMAGDAGGFFDPIFSSGVYMATFSAKKAVEMLVAADRKNRPLTAAECQSYGAAIKKHAGIFQKLIATFYDNDSFSIFMAERPPLKLDDAVNSVVGGHAEMPWPLWWRFKLFLFFCKFQKRYKLGRSVDFTGMNAVDPAQPAFSAK